MSGPAKTKTGDLVERYLAAVKRRLPNAQAADITAELREALNDKLEAKEAELGRAAGADDVAAVLRVFGSPPLVAARYAGREYLIGPGLYPYFWQTQRIAVGLAIALAIVVAAVRSVQASDPMRVVWRGMSAAWEAGIFVFGVVTVVFLVMEQTGVAAKFEAAWDPRHLPRDNIRKPVSLFESLVALAFDALFIAWWVGVLRFENIIPDRWVRDSADLVASAEFSDAWGPVFLPVLALAILTALVHVADVFHPAWSRVRAAVVIAGNAGGLAVLWVLAQGGDLVDVVASTEGAEGAARLQVVLNNVAEISLPVAAIVFAIHICIEAWRVAGALRMRPPPAMA